MPRRPDDDTLARHTLTHYEQHAEDYRDGTADHDVSQNVDALLRAIDGTPPYRILDLGCGPGRDLRTFRDRGHEAIGVDGAEAFVRIARAETGCAVWHQNFLSLDLPEAHFDGVFANAALFHTPRAGLPGVLTAIRRGLKPHGVLFCSNPRGDNQEGFNGSRYGCYYDLPTWQALLASAGFDEIEHYYRPPGRPRHEQPWLASVWRRRD